MNYLNELIILDWNSSISFWKLYYDSKNKHYRLCCLQDTELKCDFIHVSTEESSWTWAYSGILSSKQLFTLKLTCRLKLEKLKSGYLVAGSMKITGEEKQLVYAGNDNIKVRHIKDD